MWVFHTQDITLSLPKDKVLTIKAKQPKGPLPPHAEDCEATGLNEFCQHGTTTGKTTLSILKYWLKKNYKSPANLFKGLKPNPKASQALHWCCTFKAQPKLICRPLIEEVVTTDASKEDYGSHMNNLSFQGR